MLVAGALALCSGLTLLLLLILQLSGVVAAFDRQLCALIESRLGESLSQAVPGLVLWLVAVTFAVLAPLVLLHCPRAWQRWLLWGASLVVIALWAPVLGLAAHRPEISLVFSAALISGALSLMQHAWLRRTFPGMTPSDHEAS